MLLREVTASVRLLMFSFDRSILANLYTSSLCAMLSHVSNETDNMTVGFHQNVGIYLYHATHLQSGGEVTCSEICQRPGCSEALLCSLL